MHTLKCDGHKEECKVEINMFGVMVRSSVKSHRLVSGVKAGVSHWQQQVRGPRGPGPTPSSLICLSHRH
ncbi:hypothetical protein J6590_032824 [Homalodisca vitripennis]|nr:hypothetical protein J6590_032824 [Homalodisca vitripennis]